MSKLLSELLGAGEPMFSQALSQLEKASLEQGVDVQMTADIITRGHAAIRALGLDTNDTNGPELYHALKNMAALHDGFLARRLGAVDPSDVSDMLRRIRVVAQNVPIPRTAWVVKHSAMKRLLKTAQPKHTMKALGYRSLDSMLKREPIGIIHAVMRAVETATWQHKLVASYKKLKPADFEIREIEIINWDPKHDGSIFGSFLRQKHHNIMHSKELGTIVILPLPVKKLPGITLAVLPRVFHYMNEIRIYSAYFKLQQMRADFGAVVSASILHDPEDQVRVAGQPVHWRMVQRRYGLHLPENEALPELFEPHVQREDVAWRTAEHILFAIEPALHFWHDLECVGRVYGNERVSFNLIDMAANYVNNLPYGRQTSEYMRRSIWSELMSRYLKQPSVEQRVLQQLGADAAEPVMKSLSLKGAV